MSVVTGSAEVAGASLFYELSGAGSPLVLVHAMTLDHRTFDPQVGALAERHRVLRYDCRGYGRSSLPGSVRYAHGRDLVALLDSVGIDEPVAVFGVSMGGQIGLETALRSPERVRAVVTLGSVVGGWTFSPSTQALLGAIAQAVASGGVDAAKIAWRESALFTHARRDPAVRSLVDAMLDDYSGWHWVNQSVLDPLQPPMIERLAELAVPVLALVGEHDSEDARRAAELIAAKAPRAESRVLPGLGHLANLEAPELVTRLVLEFCARG